MQRQDQFHRTGGELSHRNLDRILLRLFSYSSHLTTLYLWLNRDQWPESLPRQIRTTASFRSDET